MPSRRAKTTPATAAPVDDDLNHWSAQRVQARLEAGGSIPRKEKLEVRSSPVHGKGVFARVPFTKGDFVVAYAGAIIDWPEALRRHPHDPGQPNHTFYFSLNEDWVIDGNDAGNRARWINHSCSPNCESEIKGKKVYIRALRDIAVGEELNYDYGLTIDEPMTAQLKRDYQCRCGNKNCRGTLLAQDD